MRLLFKHLLRDILHSLPRTILLIITLSLSCAISISALGTYKMFREHAEKVASPYAALGDIILLSASSDENLVFERQAQEKLGDRGKILGEFEFTAFTNDGQPVKISATDLQKADAFYQFKYHEYGKFTTENLKNSIIVSSTFAKRNSLSLGDTLTLNVFGTEKSYTIEAIAEPQGLFVSSDILISISVIKQTLAANIPIVSALGDRVTPYTKLIVKLYDSSYAESVTSELSNSLPQYSVMLTNNKHVNDFSLMITLGSILLLALVVVILATTLTLGCMTILNRKRRREYALFGLLGTEQKHITALRLFESAIYSAISTILGISLAGLMLPHISSLFVWQTEVLRLTWRGILFGIFFTPLLVLGCTLISIHRQKKDFAAEEISQIKENDSVSRRTSPHKLIVFAIFALIFTLISFIIPRAYSLFPALIAILFLLITLYSLVPLALSSICGKIADLRTKATASRGRGVLTLRQFQNVYALKHVCRLATLLIALLVSVNFCRAAISGASTLMRTTLCAEYAVVNVDHRTEQKLSSLDYIEAVSKIGSYDVTELSRGYTLSAFSAKGDVELCISEKMLPEQMPTGNEAVISKGVASICALEVGDNFDIKINGVIHTLTIFAIHDNAINSIYIDAEALGLDYLMCLIKLNESANSIEDVRKELTAELSPFGASVIEPTALFGTRLDSAQGFSALASYTVSICTILVTLGLCDTLIAHYKERRREYNALAFAGMSKRRLTLGNILQAAEIILLAILFAIPASVLISLLLDVAAGSFGFSLFDLLS